MTHRSIPWLPRLALAIALAATLAASGCKRAPKGGDKKSSGVNPTAMSPHGAKGMKANEKGALEETWGDMRSGQPRDRKARPALVIATTPPTAGRPKPAAAAGPTTLKLVLGLNAAKLRKSFIWKMLIGLPMVQKIVKSDIFGKIKQGLGQDPLKVIDFGVFALGGRSWSMSEPESIALIARGRFDTAKVLKVLERLPVQGSTPPKRTKIAGKDALTDSGGKKDAFALIAVDRNTLVFCSMSLAERAAKGEPDFGDAVIAKYLKPVKQKALFWGVFGTIDIPASARSGMPGPLAGLTRISGGSFQIDAAGARWKMWNRVDLGDAAVATKLLTFIKMAKTALGVAGKSPGGPPPVVAAIVKKLDIKTAGPLLLATLELTETEVRSLVGQLLSKL